jgi:hypothetical protein
VREEYAVDAPGRQWHGQEEYTPDTSKIESTETYSPKLVGGMWYWWSGRRGNLHPYHGEKTLQHLLD